MPNWKNAGDWLALAAAVGLVAGGVAAKRFRGGRNEDDDEDEDDFDLEEELREGVVIRDARGSPGAWLRPSTPKWRARAGSYQQEVPTAGYTVTFSGSLLGRVPTMKAALAVANDRMEQASYYPNLFYVNERGNVDLLSQTGRILRSWV
jgi:hypothetical protein